MKNECVAQLLSHNENQVGKNTNVINGTLVWLSYRI